MNMGKKRAASEVSDDSLLAKKPRTAPAGAGSSGVKKDADGNDYWEVYKSHIRAPWNLPLTAKQIADKRRVTISQFKNQHLVSIREYYEQSGEMKPGKKGISLTVAQFTTLIEQLPAIEKSLRAAGQSIARPKYDEGDGGGEQEGNEDEEVPDAGAEEKVETKKNFEETSEEE